MPYYLLVYLVNICLRFACLINRSPFCSIAFYPTLPFMVDICTFACTHLNYSQLVSGWPVAKKVLHFSANRTEPKTEASGGEPNRTEPTNRSVRTDEPAVHSVRRFEPVFLVFLSFFSAF